LHVYVLLNPHLGGRGGNNSARRAQAAGQPVLLCWQERTYLAVAVNNKFLKTSCGYVGKSDGWQDLHENFQMDWEFERADQGNIAVIGEIDLSTSSEFTVGLSFGEGAHAAVSTLLQALRTPFDTQLARFTEQWHRVCCNIMELDRHAGDEGHLYRLSHNVLLAHEDKTYAGAFVASASIPWGEAKTDEELGGYHLVWTRDMVNTATALLACGNIETPCRALVYLAASQQSDGGFPQNFWIDGTAYWTGIQLDPIPWCSLGVFGKPMLSESLTRIRWSRRLQNTSSGKDRLPSRSGGKKTAATRPQRWQSILQRWYVRRISRARAAKRTPLASWRNMPIFSNLTLSNGQSRKRERWWTA
jgi:glucoamylase